MNKLSIVLIGVLIGLFMMVSGLVAATAYVSNNQPAFVKATIELNIDFGNVFPGQMVTESFTIGSENSSDYTITLVAPTDAGKLDIRPYLTVWKDPSETDPDGPVSGAPNYTGTGSFTSPSDLSDTWLVTFSVPDVTLPKNVELDYGCTISIEPVVAPPPMPTGDLILRPNGDGILTEFDLPAEGSHWNMVDDIGTHDGDVTYVDDTTNNKIDLYDIENSGLPAGTSIYKVTLFAVMKGDGTDRTNGFFGLKSGTNEYWGTRKSSLPTSYTYFSRTYVKDPATGLDWTVAVIDALQLGFFVDDFSGSGLRATQIYVVVDITP